MATSDVCGLSYAPDWTFSAATLARQRREKKRSGTLIGSKEMRDRTPRSPVRKRPLFLRRGAIMDSEEHDAGPPNLFPSPTLARPALRRQILYRRRWQRRLLPLHLSRAYRQRKELPLLSDCCRGR